MRLTGQTLISSVLLALIPFLPSKSFCQSNPESFVLATIKVTGLQDFDETRVIATSGLHNGQRVKVQDLQTAAQKLAQSGFFQSVNFSYTYDQGKMNVEFKVVEAQDFLPCLFDNFIWFSVDDLVQAVETKVPLFKGTIPHLGTAIQNATLALQDLLVSRKIPGTVTSLMNEDKQNSKRLVLMFQVSGVDLSIKALKFPGAKAVSEDELQEASRLLLDQQYSKTYLMKFAEQTLAPLFRSKGYLRISFRDPQATFQTESANMGYLNVVMGINEGIAYNWEKPTWTGDLTSPTEELDQILGLKSGDLADGVKIEKGLKTIREQMGKRGFMEAQTKTAQDFDDLANKVRYSIEIVSGPQYHMGTVAFKGLPEDAVKRLQSKWRLRTGDIFDLSYANNFLKNDARDEIARIRPTQVTTATAVDRQRLTIDITFEFK